MRNAARSLRPDFVRRSAVMRLPIRRIAVLVGVKIFVGLCGNNLVYLANRAVRALIARRDDQFRAIRLEDALALLRSAVRQAKLHGIPHRRANHGVGDTRVTAGGIKDGLAGSERAAGQPGFNHAQRGAVLYRPAGIEPFRLGITLDVGELLAHSLQPQQGRIPNAVEQSLAATARPISWPTWPTLVRFTEIAAIVTLDPLCGMSKNGPHRKRSKVWRRWGSR